MHNSKLTHFVGAIFLVMVLASMSLAVMPPAQNVEFPTHVKEAQKEISKTYRESGIATRLEQRAKELQEMQASGVSAKMSAITMAVPVIVGSYSDNANLFSAATFQSHLFGVNPSGSMKDYYTEVSYGNLTLNGTVYGPYTAANTQAYYVNGDNGFGSDYPTNAGGFIVSLLTTADGSINFAAYDNDGPDGTPNSGDDDGFVDGLVVCAPDGDGSGGDNDNMWAHKWNLSFSGYGSSFSTNDAAFGGGFIQIDVYSIQGSEQGDGTWNVIKPVGVYCHEFGHILGLPDLYDGDGSSNAIGTYGLMGSGSWGANWSSSTEHHPVHMNAWSKAMLGFLTPIVVTGTQAVNLPPVETTPTVYKLWDDAYQGGRYFLLENRTKTGFDIDFYGEGVLVWHCNDDIRYDNSVDGFRIVDLEEADGLNELDNSTNWMDADDFYSGSTATLQFDDFTNPSAFDAYGVATGAVASFTNVAAGATVPATLTQRVLSGYTIYYDTYNWVRGWGFGTSQINHGAVRFTTPTTGTLVSVQAGCWASNPVGYTVEVWDDIIGGTKTGFHSTTSGSFPSNPNDRYHEISLSSSFGVSAGQVFVVNVAFGPDVYAVPHSNKPPFSGNSYFSQTGAASTYSNWTDKDALIRARIATTIDTDGDGVPDGIDNCPLHTNPSQIDSDGDGNGDACDLCPGFNDNIDADGDGVPDACDICPGGDDLVDTDIDGIPNACDNCPNIWNQLQVNQDTDSLGDLCDNCVFIDNNDQIDSDGDNRGDICDVCPGGDDFQDFDGDGVPDDCDQCQGFPDNQDADGDGVPDACDACPGFNDNLDADGDFVPDACDICPGFDDNLDGDFDGVPDGCDICAAGDDTQDTDSDGVPDACDACPGFDDAQDSDGDLVPDGCDACPGFDDTQDSDGDGVANGCDACPGFDDNADMDSDGIADGCDNCPTKSNPGQEDANNDNIGDACCCILISGNANGDLGDNINISDVTYLTSYLFGIPTGPAPICNDEGNANGDLGGAINIADVSYLVAYLFGVPTGPTPPACP